MLLRTGPSHFFGEVLKWGRDIVSVCTSTFSGSKTGKLDPIRTQKRKTSSPIFQIDAKVRALSASAIRPRDCCRRSSPKRRCRRRGMGDERGEVRQRVPPFDAERLTPRLTRLTRRSERVESHPAKWCEPRCVARSTLGKSAAESFEQSGEHGVHGQEIGEETARRVPDPFPSLHENSRGELGERLPSRGRFCRRLETRELAEGRRDESFFERQKDFGCT